MAHRTIASVARFDQTVKGSRFRAIVAPLDRPEAAAAWLAQVRIAERDAQHVAWASRWGAVVRWSDDGEPGGTAGRPMLEVLMKRDLDRVVAIVARVFGGVKLGAGGLARAYGGSVARALDAARILDVPDRRAFRVRVPFADVDALLRLLAEAAVEHEPPAFDDAGAIVRGSVLARAGGPLHDRAVEVTRGRAAWAWCPGSRAEAAPGGEAG